MHRLTLALLLALGCASDDNDPGGFDDPDGGDGSDGGAIGSVPASPDALFDFLAAGEYLGFEVESGVHVSAGPHGSGVRTFLSADLAASLAAGNSEHPIGAAAIKELYGSDGETVTGWAAMVKVEAGSSGSSWYFYEVFSTTDGSSPIGGVGSSICTGCHSSGADFIRVPYPLQ
jgi:hypothetical protein